MGSSKKQTVGYRYYLGMHMILCHGPIDFITSITVDKRKAWTGTSTGGSIGISAEGLFGGDEREGGVSGTVDLEMGRSDQGRNAYLQSKLGSSIPAFRKVVGMVLRQCYMGMNPYLKPWGFRGQRIHVRQDGLDQWNDPFSEVNTYSETESIPATTEFDYVIKPGVVDTSTPEAVAAIVIPRPAEFTSRGSAPFGRAGTGGSLVPVHPIQTFWGYNTTLWLRKLIYCDGSVPLRFTGYVENAVGFYLDGRLVGSVNFDNTQSATPSGIPFDITVPTAEVGFHVLHVLVLDEDDGDPPPSHEALEANDNTYFFCEIAAREVNRTTGDMNPAHIIRECLTDPDWGMGYSEADVDDESFAVAAYTLYFESMGISILWDRQTPIEDFINEIVKHISASLYVDRRTGKFVLKLIRADYDVDDLLVLDESHIQKVEGATRPTAGELVNSVTAVYWDTKTGENASVTVQDQALIQMQGAVINTTLQYPGFTNQAIASKAALRALTSLSVPLLSCTIYADRAASELNIGDVFVMTWPDLQVQGLVMRVTAMALGDGKSNVVKLTVVEDVFATPAVTVVSADPPPGPDSGDPSAPAQAAGLRVAMEVPYYEAVQRFGQAQVDSTLASGPDVGYVMVGAARPNVELNVVLQTDSGAGFEDAATFDFCPGAALTADAGRMDGSFSISPGKDLDLATTGSWAAVVSANGVELVRIDAIAPGSVSVGRAVLDSVPLEHPSGASLVLLDFDNGVDPTEYVSGETVAARLLPVSGSGRLATSDAPVDEVTLAGRAFRPYPPGNFQVNGEYYPADLAGETDIVLTWAHRDRLLQTGGELVDFLDGDVGPEPGVTYTVEAYGIDGSGVETVFHSTSGITGVTHTIDTLTDVPPAGSVYLSVRVHAVRDSVESLFKQRCDLTVLTAPYNLTAEYTE